MAKNVDVSKTEGPKQKMGQMKEEGARSQRIEVNPECPARHNFDQECEKALNEHIQLELRAAYGAQNMWAFYGRDCKGSIGMTRLCEWASLASNQRAKRMAAYVLYRGGHVEYQDIPKPHKDSWKDFNEAFEDCIANKKKIYSSLQAIYKCCNEKDGHCSNFIQDDLMDEVVAWNKFFADCLGNLNCTGGEGLGAWVFDRWLAKVVGSKFQSPKIPSLSTRDMESNVPNEVFDAEGIMMHKVGALKI